MIASCQALGTALQAQGSVEEEEWEVVKASSAHSCDSQPLDSALLRDLGSQVINTEVEERAEELRTCRMHLAKLESCKSVFGTSAMLKVMLSIRTRLLCLQKPPTPTLAALADSSTCFCIWNMDATHAK